MWWKAKQTKPKEDGRVAPRLAAAILSFQKRVSMFLNRRTAHLGRRGKIALLLGVVFCLGGLSIVAVIGAFISSNSYQRSLRPVALSVPRYDQNKYREGPRVSSKDMERIVLFRNYLDSLSKDIHGRHRYDSILSSRPHLLDSLNAIISFYYSPLKP